MAHNYTCKDQGVCTEALPYLEGFKWDYDAAVEACRNKTLPSLNLDPSPSSSQTTTDSSGVFNKTLPFVNVDPSPSKLQTTTDSSGVFNQPTETQPLNEIHLPLMGSSQLQDSSPRNRWSTYVKRCHEMIVFLITATLVYLPIRYVIDAQRKCESQLHLEDYIKVILRFLGDISMVDPFLFLAFAYAVIYIVASASLSRPKVQVAELVSIFLRFGMVFLMTFYISPTTFWVCVAFGFVVGAITIREFCLARRDS